MQRADWIQHAATAFLTPLCTALVMAGMLWAARPGQGTVDSEGRLCLRYGLFVRGFALAYALLFGLATTASVLGMAPRDPVRFWLMTGFFSACTALALAWVWDTQVYLLRISPDGLSCRSPWRGWQSIGWKQIVEVSYRANGSWFLVVASDGTKIRVPIHVGGVLHFVHECFLRLPLSTRLNMKRGYLQLKQPFLFNVFAQAAGEPPSRD